MTELSFLIELLLNHDLPKITKDLVASRIKEVEAWLQTKPQPQMQVNWNAGAASHGNKLQQAPSTLALMAKHGDLSVNEAPIMPPIPDLPPVTQVAHTPAAAAALNSRSAAINASIERKIDKETGRPKKW